MSTDVVAFLVRVPGKVIGEGPERKDPPELNVERRLIAKCHFRLQRYTVNFETPKEVSLRPARNRGYDTCFEKHPNQITRRVVENRKRAGGCRVPIFERSTSRSPNAFRILPRSNPRRFVANRKRAGWFNGPLFRSRAPVAPMLRLLPRSYHPASRSKLEKLALIQALRTAG